MKLCKIIPILALTLSLQGCFFVYIPGSVISGISDGLTGSEGSNCVGSNAKVGDRIRLPDGSTGVVKSLSGTSTRCTVPSMPIRALLEPISNSNGATNSIPFKSNASIELPTGWASADLTDELKRQNYIFHAINRTIDAGLLLGTVKRDTITDMLEFVKTTRTAQLVALKDATSTDIQKIEVNGFPAWRFDVSGKVPTKGMDLTYSLTVIESGNEAVGVKTWILTASFPDHKEQLYSLASDVRGLEPPASKNAPVPESSKKTEVAPKTQASPDVRLGELNKLYKDGLITKKEYDAKKQEILKGL